MTRIPFSFVIENLEKLSPVVRPMFGCHAVYISEKIVLAVRKKDARKQDNGIWIATSPEHHAALRKVFPHLRPITIFGKKGSSWQVLPEDSDDFEEAALRLCELIEKGDPRIGKVPKTKKNKK